MDIDNDLDDRWGAGDQGVGVQGEVLAAYGRGGGELVRRS